MDLNRMLGALLGGAAAPPRRRRTTSSYGGSYSGARGSNAQLGRILGTAAATAIEALMRSSQTPSAPPPRKPTREAPYREAPYREPAAPPPVSKSRPPEQRATASRPWGDTAPAPSPWGRAAEPAPQASGAPFAEDAEALLLIRAMIAAAKADGAVDAAERRLIAEQLDSAGLAPQERDYILADFEKPMVPEALAKHATDPMLRARLYAAAVAATGEVTASERAWLDRLAGAMKLDRAAAAAIEERLSA